MEVSGQWVANGVQGRHGRAGRWAAPLHASRQHPEPTKKSHMLATKMARQEAASTAQLSGCEASSLSGGRTLGRSRVHAAMLLGSSQWVVGRLGVGWGMAGRSTAWHA